MTDWLTNQPTPWSRVLLEKQTVSKSRNLPPFYVTRLKVHYRVYKNPSLVPILMQIDPVHTFITYFSKIHSNIIPPSMPRCCKWSLPFIFSNQNCIYFHLTSTCYMPCQSHRHKFDHPNNIWWNLEVTNILIMKSSPVWCDFLPPSQVVGVVIVTRDIIVLSSKYSPQHPFLKHPKFAPFP